MIFPTDATTATDQRMATARLGVTLEEAREQPLYKFLAAKSRLAVDAAVQEFIEADATNASVMLRLQGELRRHADLVGWVARAIQEGHAAHEELHREDYEGGES